MLKLTTDEQIQLLRATIVRRITMHTNSAERAERLADRYYREGRTELYRDRDVQALQNRAYSRVCSGILADLDIITGAQKRTSCLKDNDD
jgi:hypothetical protein